MALMRPAVLAAAAVSTNRYPASALASASKTTTRQDGTGGEIIFAVANYTAGDVFIGVSSASGAVLLTGMRRPVDVRPSLIFISFFVEFGLSYAIFSERLNVPARESWAYFSLMPVIPLLDTGLLPILQWILVPMLG